MSSASRLLVVLALALGCTPMFGLDMVVVDSDLDGIPDDQDVCPFDYDPAQNGNACSECTTITRDLDQDGRDDACDGCIGPGVTGLDADGDGIDDGCDPCVDGVPVSLIDVDGNGKPDACEPCPPIGVDLDRDGVDDACDLCLLGDDNDEDGDGVPNACDVCPADADNQERANDELNVGIACDPGPGRHTRRLFDGFDRDDDGIWLPQPGFEVATGALHVVGQAGRRLSFYEVRQDFVVRAFVRFSARSGNRPMGIDAGWQQGTLYGLLRCGIDADGHIYTTEFLSSPSPSTARVDTSEGAELRIVRPTRFDLTSAGWRCEVRTPSELRVVTTRGLPPAEDYNIALFAAEGAAGAYEWIEAIDQTSL
jgi:hypothetical protein